MLRVNAHTGRFFNLPAACGFPPPQIGAIAAPSKNTDTGTQRNNSPCPRVSVSLQ
ncbi:hypothetical protein [Nostoc sp.]|uniref:hypothetical protein n=1 Tax=Nostoc sp. TaxID=1180 RepID=UPI002FF7D88A